MSCSTAYAATSNSLTVRVLGDGNPVSSLYVELLAVAVEGDEGYELDVAFAEGPRNVEDLLTDSGSDAAWDLYQYTWAADTAGAVKRTDASGNAVFRNLSSGLYLVMERGDQAVTFSPYLIWLPQVTDSSAVHDVVSAPKTSATDTHSLRVEKLWDDNDDAAGARPSSLEITLLRDGAVLQVVDLSPANLWQYTFRGLPGTGEYSIAESPVEDYELSEVSFDPDGSAMIVNEYVGSVGGDDVPAAVVAVKKMWVDDDNAEGSRPSSVIVQLIEEGVVADTAALSESNGWSHVFKGLDNAKSYTVKEMAVENYTATYAGSASTVVVVTNEYTPGATDPGTPPPPEIIEPELVDIVITKIWVDEGNVAGARPDEIAVHLLSEGSLIETAYMSVEAEQVDVDTWRYVCKDLHPYRSYSIWEEPVEDYTATYSGNARDGFTVTNTYTAGTTDPGVPSDPSVPGEDPEDPVDPDGPGSGGGSEPEIPQTGNRPLSAMVLVAVGLVLMALGLVDLWRRRSEECLS